MKLPFYPRPIIIIVHYAELYIVQCFLCSLWFYVVIDALALAITVIIITSARGYCDPLCLLVRSFFRWCVTVYVCVLFSY